MQFLYSYGATLNVVKPSVVALSSGTMAIPSNRPICAYYFSPTSSGKLVVLGSSRFLTDSYIDKEHNDIMREMIFDFFQLKDNISMDNIHLDDIDVKFIINYYVILVFKSMIFFCSIIIRLTIVKY